MRGEYDGQLDGKRALRGSPPHAWGIRTDNVRGYIWNRFTPTCVGNTHAVLFGLAGKSVHPHMRGEYENATEVPCLQPVHPHMRGEYQGALGKYVLVDGSPPHAWGILVGGFDLRLAFRFTPTCVGNTALESISHSWITVHPHMRGEYNLSEDNHARVIGSPPHAWGILIFHLVSFPRRRFTPTCVGNTAPLYDQLAFSSVHPHMRGEYAQYFGVIPAQYGSPPHAWGILPALCLLEGPPRFTPTCVGNTPAIIMLYGSAPVHPHMRGEYAPLPTTAS